MPFIKENVRFRTVMPTDIPRCFEIETASYPSDEAASRSSLQYRQHHAEKYFRCAVFGDEEDEVVIGFICATRCKVFDEEAMSTHDSSGPLLAVHSVVVDATYRRLGVAFAMMKDYINTMRQMQDGVESLVLISKADLLAFYIKCGFSVLRPSQIHHGGDLWFHVEMDVRLNKGHLYWVVDSFTETAGCGNPAAVVLLPHSTDPDTVETQTWMQKVAKEFNLSETAFVWPKSDVHEGRQRVDYNIRYYTPLMEVDLCGHATLASAAILFQNLPFKVKVDATIVFEGKNDVLTMHPFAEGNKSWTGDGKCMKISMDFPLRKVVDVTCDSDRTDIFVMLEATFRRPNGSLKDNVVFMGLDDQGGDILIELTAEYFDSLGFENIQYNELMKWDGYTAGVIVCCASGTNDEGIDFLSRYFRPKAGLDEDPVTGAAHCRLGPYFSEKLGKKEVTGYQASERGGLVHCVLGDDRINIIGTAVTTMNGSLWIERFS